MVANFSPKILGRLDINRFCLSITISDDNRTNSQKKSRYFNVTFKTVRTQDSDNGSSNPNKRNSFNTIAII